MFHVFLEDGSTGCCADYVESFDTFDEAKAFVLQEQFSAGYYITDDEDGQHEIWNPNVM